MCGNSPEGQGYRHIKTWLYRVGQKTLHFNSPYWWNRTR